MCATVRVRVCVDLHLALTPGGISMFIITSSEFMFRLGSWALIGQITSVRCRWGAPGVVEWRFT